METKTKPTISNNWRYKISIKDKFQDETTAELIAELSESMPKQLSEIKKQVANSTLVEDEKSDLDNELEELVGHFDFLKELANGTITEDEWGDYSFDGDFEQWFNDYLTQTYDLGDRRVLNKHNVLEKFMWIE